MKNKIKFLIKSNRFFQVIYKTIFSFIMKIISLFIRVDNNLFLFTGHSGGINDSPYEIYKYMKTLSNDNLRVVWGIDKKTVEIIDDVKYVQLDSFKYFVTSMKAKYWIASVNIERGLNYKKKNQVYLNTWHGVPIKTIGNDAVGRRDYNFSKIDYFVVSSEYESNIYKRAFKIREESLLRVGLPRNEELFSPVESIEMKEIKREFNIPFDKKIILYAPTWRESSSKGKSYELAPPITLSKWKNAFSRDYVMLFRLHPYTDKIININYDDFAYNVSAINSVNKLLKIADILITDYSAIAFDFSITKKPMFCFPYDIKEYAKNRGLYMDLEKKFPLGINITEDELIYNINNFDKDSMKSEVINFKNSYIVYHGQSAKKCFDILTESHVSI